jgi:two-component system LytT family response regulator
LPNLRTLIVDDEPLALRLMESMLNEADDIEVIGSCRNGREAVAKVQDLAPDLLILDIQMPGINGFDVIKELQADLLPMVIFCTAYQRYALEAFDLHAVDYLLKPVSSDRLHLALERARSRMGLGAQDRQRKSDLIGAIEEIATRSHEKDQASSGGAPPVVAAERKIAIKDVDTVVMVDIDDIDWVDAAGDYMCVHAKGVTHIMRSTLKALMEKLENAQFKRIHRSTIVNLNCITQVNSLPRGEYLLDLNCGERLKVSRNYRDVIKVFLDAH